MDISAFRHIGQVSNAHVLLDVGANELKVRRQTFLNRAVDWIRARVSPDPLATTARDVAHNRFLAAIAASPAYDPGDVSRAEALLSVDVIAGRPLSSRRVREVIADLDGRSTPVVRDNRTTVAWMSTRGVDLRLRDRDESLAEDERALVGARIEEAIGAAAGGELRKVGFAEASRATEQAVDGYLAERAARAEAAERAGAEAPVRTSAEPREQSALRPGPLATAQATAATAEVPRTGPARAQGDRAAVASQPTPPASPREARARRHELERALAKAKLPAELRPELRALVKRGAVSDKTGLARRANRATAGWVMENRVGRWYGEALKKAGARGRIRNGEELMAPTRMLDRVRESIADAGELLAYPDVKKLARALIAEHVRSENGAGSEGLERGSKSIT